MAATSNFAPRLFLIFFVLIGRLLFLTSHFKFHKPTGHQEASTVSLARIYCRHYAFESLPNFGGKFKLWLIRNGFHFSRIPVGKWTKHGFIALVIPGHDPPTDITIYLDIAVNPGPNNTNTSSNQVIATIHTTSTTSTIRYTSQQLTVLRRNAHLPTPTVISLLKDLHLFRFRGKRGGKQTKSNFRFNQRRDLEPKFMQTCSVMARQTHTSQDKDNVRKNKDKGKTPSPKALQLALLNARSLNNKSLIIKDYVVENNIDIMAFTETWLKPDTNDNTTTIRNLCPQGYAFYHLPRQNRTGGGVGLLYNKQLKKKQIC